MEDYHEISLKNICCTCLSTERSVSQLCRVDDGVNNLFFLLSYKSEAYEAIFVKDMTEFYICWECTALMRRLSRFREQACVAQAKLNDIADGKIKYSNIKSLSKLSVSHQTEYDRIFVDIKVEVLDPFVDCGPASVGVKCDSDTDEVPLARLYDLKNGDSGEELDPDSVVEPMNSEPRNVLDERSGILYDTQTLSLNVPVEDIDLASESINELDATETNKAHPKIQKMSRNVLDERSGILYDTQTLSLNVLVEDIDLASESINELDATETNKAHPKIQKMSRNVLDERSGILYNTPPVSFTPSENIEQQVYSSKSRNVLDERSGILYDTQTLSLNVPVEDIDLASKNELDATETNKAHPKIQKMGRKRKHPECDREINKKNRNSNRRYYDYKGNVKEPRVYKDYECKCTKKCHESVSSSFREAEFKRFWNLGSYVAQNAYIAAKIIEKPVKRSYTKNICKKKSFSRQYVLDHVVVCKEMFMNTYKMTSSRVDTALKKVNSRAELSDRRGARGGHNKIPDNKRTDIINFIKKFLPYKSYYGHAETESKFLNPTVSLSKLIELYKAEFKDDAVSVSTFRSIFYKEFKSCATTLKASAIKEQ